MKFCFTDVSILNCDEQYKIVTDIIANELEKRTGKKPATTDEKKNCFVLNFDESKAVDEYEIFLDENENSLCFYGKTVRELIFAFGHFLRKCEFENGEITLIQDITGTYTPDKKIRGHQIGFRDINNTYDAWTPEVARQYFIDSMFYGCNIVELIPDYDGEGKELNRVMPCTQEEFVLKCTEYADELNLDVSMWIPNDKRSIEESAKIRKDTAESLARLDVIFPPGGDPGDYPADEFIARCRKISEECRKVKPDVEMWPSAQAPHSIKNWGDVFIEEICKIDDDSITGVIQGPNRAFDIDELRRKLPAKYPIRLYPDITHNLRCEYSVHYPKEDWNVALASVNSRESVNPRPVEFRRIHRQTRPYTVGSVTYSEGVNDDLNKVVWGMLEFDNNAPLNEIVEDYCRLFFYGAPAKECADGIFSLERNWVGSPEENPDIDNSYKIFTGVLSSYPQMYENWRFMMCVYRAMFDKLIKMRMEFENSLIKEAEYVVRKHSDLKKAIEILDTDYTDEYKNLYNEIFKVGDKIFELIGMQTSVERHGAARWERGSVLDTINRPVTNRKWIKKRYEKAIAMDTDTGVKYMLKVFDRNKVDADETYFSFGVHGYEILGAPQTGGEPYINFMGDKPENENGDIPMEMVKVYDHYSLHAVLAGFTADCDYKLRITFHNCNNEGKGKYSVTANGKTIYSGVRFGGEKDPEYDEMMLAPGFLSVSYTLTKDVFENGCLDLLIAEEEAGCEISEFSIRKM